MSSPSPKYTTGQRIQVGLPSIPGGAWAKVWVIDAMGEVQSVVLDDERLKYMNGEVLKSGEFYLLTES